MKRILLFIFLTLLFSCKKESKILHEDSNYQKARSCRDSYVTDSAFYYYNLAKNDFLKVSDSLGVGNSLVNMAVIQTNKGDFFGGIESSLEANKFLKKNKDSAHRRALAVNYNNIGLSFHFLKDFEKSSLYYIKTLQYIDSDEDRNLCYNNIGDLLISQGKLDSAKIYLEKALITKDSGTLSKVINNLAKVKYLINNDYNPLPEFYHALKIRELRNDELGRNSSFETLSTYFLNRDNNLSLSFAKNMLDAALKNESPDDQITALKRIITLDSKNYLQNFQKFDSINDHLQITQSKHKNQFALIRFDVEKITKESTEKS
uniref:tetratricopeptide repeat protein n=1 Tax=Chryseobacterium sp. TaxID=1871047 RepID=UPI00321982D0